MVNRQRSLRIFRALSAICVSVLSMLSAGASAIHSSSDVEMPSGHTDEITCIALSNDGKYLATGSADTTIRIWDIATLREKSRLTKHMATIRVLNFSDDGSRLVALDADGNVKVWNWSLRSVESAPKYEDAVLNVDFQPGSNAQLNVLEAKSKDEYSTLEHGAVADVKNASKELLFVHGSQRSAVPKPLDAAVFAVSKTGVVVFGCESGQVVTFDPLTKQTNAFKGFPFPVKEVEVDADASTCQIMTETGETKIVNLKTQKELLAKAPSESFSSKSHSISSNGHFALIEDVVYDTSAGKELANLAGKLDFAISMDRGRRSVFDENGKILINAKGAVLEVVNLTEATPKIQKIESNSGAIIDMRYSAKTGLAGIVTRSPLAQNPVHILDYVRGVHTHDIPGSGPIGFDDSGRLLVVNSGKLPAWDLDQGIVVSKCPGEVGSDVRVASAAPVCLHRTSSPDMVHVWNFTNKTERNIAMPESCYAAYIVSDGSKIVFPYKKFKTVNKETVTEYHIQLKDVAQEKILWDKILPASIFDKDDEISAFATNSKFIACSGKNGVIALIDLATGNVAKELKGHTSTVTALAFDPKATSLASGSKDKTVRLWDTASGRPLKELSAHEGPIGGLFFADDGLVTGGWDGLIKVWDLTDGTVKRTMVANKQRPE